MQHRVKEKEIKEEVTETINKNDTKYDSAKHKDKLISRLPQKEFEKRKSILSEIYESDIHIRAVLNIIIGFVIFNVITSTLREYVYQGRLPSAFHLIYNKFAKLDLVAIIWIANNLISFICYYGFVFWGKVRIKLSKKFIWDRFSLTIFLTYFAILFYLNSYIVTYLDIPFGSACIVSAESLRLAMKVYSFVRSNTPKILVKSKNNELSSPTFGNYLYFLFAPTLIYREEYPRLDRIRWKFVLQCFLEVLGLIVAFAFLHENFAVPIFKDVCKEPISIVQFLLLVLQSGVFCTVILWLLSIVALHSTQNGVGEILRFGDRMFHTDWWNCTDLTDFFRKWNWIIGDFLYTYVHRDIIETLRPRIRILPKIATIIVSAVAHEYICTIATGFFCPIISVMLMMSVLLSYLKIGNTSNFTRIVVFSLFPMGPGVIGTFFYVEYYARQNLSKNDTISVFWTNNCIKL